jgi:cysteine synthase A
MRSAKYSLCGSAVEAIGHTPLIELKKVGEGAGGRILLKLDYLNPGFSKKDRIARQMIEDAEADWKPETGADSRRVNERQHRHGTGDRMRC